MDVSWKDLIVLVHSNVNIQATSDALIDIIDHELHQLPDVFHEVIFNHLICKSSIIRENSSYLIWRLASHFRILLSALVRESESDGELISIENLNIESLSLRGDAFLLGGISAPVNDESADVYRKEWLTNQKKELKRMLGLETDVSAVVSLADIGLGNVIDSDFKSDSKTSSLLTTNALNITNILQRPTIIASGSNTSETWLARLVRCMIVGLLQPQWETRHGYSLGLKQLILGLFPNLANKNMLNLVNASSNEISSEHEQQTIRTLPDFLVNDIIACGVCVLVLDRFLDFGTSDASNSVVLCPVKETAAQLIASVLHCNVSFAAKYSQQVWRFICKMTHAPSSISQFTVTNSELFAAANSVSSTTVADVPVSVLPLHWTIYLGGLIAMKYYIPANFNSFHILDDDSAIHNRYDQLVAVIVGGLRYFSSNNNNDDNDQSTGANEDIAIAACQLIHTLEATTRCNLLLLVDNKVDENNHNKYDQHHEDCFSVLLPRHGSILTSTVTSSSTTTTTTTVSAQYSTPSYLHSSLLLNGLVRISKQLIISAAALCDAYCPSQLPGVSSSATATAMSCNGFDSASSVQCIKELIVTMSSISALSYLFMRPLVVKANATCTKLDGCFEREAALLLLHDIVLNLTKAIGIIVGSLPSFSITIQHHCLHHMLNALKHMSDIMIDINRISSLHNIESDNITTARRTTTSSSLCKEVFALFGKLLASSALGHCIPISDLVIDSSSNSSSNDCSNTSSNIDGYNLTALQSQSTMNGATKVNKTSVMVDNIATSIQRRKLSQDVAKMMIIFMKIVVVTYRCYKHQDNKCISSITSKINATSQSTMDELITSVLIDCITATSDIASTAATMKACTSNETVSSSSENNWHRCLHDAAFQSFLTVFMHIASSTSQSNATISLNKVATVDSNGNDGDLQSVDKKRKLRSNTSSSSATTTKMNSSNQRSRSIIVMQHQQRQQLQATAATTTTFPAKKSPDCSYWWNLSNETHFESFAVFAKQLIVLLGAKDADLLSHCYYNNNNITDLSYIIMPSSSTTTITGINNNLNRNDRITAATSSTHRHQLYAQITTLIAKSTAVFTTTTTALLKPKVMPEISNQAHDSISTLPPKQKKRIFRFVIVADSTTTSTGVGDENDNKNKRRKKKDEYAATAEHQSALLLPSCGLSEEKNLQIVKKANKIDEKYGNSDTTALHTTATATAAITSSLFGRRKLKQLSEHYLLLTGLAYLAIELCSSDENVANCTSSSIIIEDVTTTIVRQSVASTESPGHLMLAELSNAITTFLINSCDAVTPPSSSSSTASVAASSSVVISKRLSCRQNLLLTFLQRWMCVLTKGGVNELLYLLQTDKLLQRHDQLDEQFISNYNNNDNNTLSANKKSISLIALIAQSFTDILLRQYKQILLPSADSSDMHVFANNSDGANNFSANAILSQLLALMSINPLCQQIAATIVHCIVKELQDRFFVIFSLFTRTQLLPEHPPSISSLPLSPSSSSSSSSSSSCRTIDRFILLCSAVRATSSIVRQMLVNQFNIIEIMLQAIATSSDCCYLNEATISDDTTIPKNINNSEYKEENGNFSNLFVSTLANTAADIVCMLLIDTTSCIEFTTTIPCNTDKVEASRQQTEYFNNQILEKLSSHMQCTLFDASLSTIAAERQQTMQRRDLIAALFAVLARRLKEKHLLLHFEVWFATALHGMGDRDTTVRRLCIQIFRLLVPLTPLAKQTVEKRRILKAEYHNRAIVSASSSNSSSGGDNNPLVTIALLGTSTKIIDSPVFQSTDQLLSHIFSKQASLPIHRSSSPIDQRIIQMLANMTNLVSTPATLTSNDDIHQYNYNNDSSSTSVRSNPQLSASKLRDYQWDGITWLTQLRRFGLCGVLADEMGLGKSLQALTALAVLRIEKNFHTEPSLIVCPASVMLHWEDEISKYFPSSLLTPIRYNSATAYASFMKQWKRRRQSNINENSCSSSSSAAAELYYSKDNDNDSGDTEFGNVVIIISYEALRRDGKNLLLVTDDKNNDRETSSSLCMLWESVILDEAHLIKNPLTATAQAVFQLQCKNGGRIALTGTPVQNQVEELWSLMNFLLPDYLGDYTSFRSSMVKPIQRSFAARKELKQQQQQYESSTATKNDKINSKVRESAALNKFHQAIDISAEGLNLLRKLHKQVLPFILRRNKSMVAKELPSKTIIDILCPLSTQQLQLYQSYQQQHCINDDALESELNAIRDTDADTTTGTTTINSKYSNDVPMESQASSTDNVEEDEDEFSQELVVGWGSKSSNNIISGSNNSSVCVNNVANDVPLFLSTNSNNKKEIKNKQQHHNPLQILTHLKLLCVHPALVVDATSHRSYHSRLLQSLKSSGKLLRLANLLMDSGVIRRDEFNSVQYNIVKELGEEEDVNNDYIIDAIDENDNNLLVTADSVVRDTEDQSNKLKSKRSNNKRSSRSLNNDNTVTSIIANAAKHIEAALLSAENDASTAISSSAAISATAAALPVTAALHRCLIFAQHKAVLDTIEQQVLCKYFPTVRYERMDGDVPPQTRAIIARKFNRQTQLGSATTATSEDIRTTFIESNQSEEQYLGEIAANIELLKGALPQVAQYKADDSHNTSGTPNDDNRKSRIDNNNEEDIRMLLMTTRSCGLGLNLTTADTVIFIEHDWNPFIDLQAMDRAHRIGQTLPVTVYRLLAQSTIEARIMGLQRLKRNIAMEIINEDNSGGIAGSSRSKHFGSILWDSLALQIKKQI